MLDIAVPDQTLIDLVCHHQGSVTQTQLQASGYTLVHIQQLCQEELLVEGAPGQYQLAETWEHLFIDALVLLQWALPEGIYGGLTALSFHDLTVLLPGDLDVCIPATWTGKIPPALQPVHLFTLSPDLRDYGVMQVYPAQPGDVPVQMYRPEVAVAQVLADPTVDREAQEECIPMYRQCFKQERARADRRLAEALERYQVTTIPRPYYQKGA